MATATGSGSGIGVGAGSGGDSIAVSDLVRTINSVFFSESGSMTVTPNIEI